MSAPGRVDLMVESGQAEKGTCDGFSVVLG